MKKRNRRYTLKLQRGNWIKIEVKYHERYALVANYIENAFYLGLLSKLGRKELDVIRNKAREENEI